ncbi:hypothetical protein FHU33_2633 [Blastococcus colisei]|uniref:Uncharacterized protein n=1 Tax=Blastococcus colisei TaxID=1564162 RepID=A0A543PGJ5_9ACTN|nr:hypothetical protein [Blastococcus colisei]TQN43198.1 hypothetical protein FHU33_2633 [Blastococcus colisei]
MDDDPSPAWIAGGACVMAGALALAACTGGMQTVCPAIGWGSALIVEFAEDWPEVPGGVTIECRPTCMQDVMAEASPAEPEQATGPLAGSSVTVSYVMSTPDPVVTVLAADGTELARADADLDWRRVGGSEECGGPMEASVVVPAP